MGLRIGRVTNVYPSTGRVRVMYEDEKNASLPIAMLTMNREYYMPLVGERVVTLHMDNGSSKGIVLGTYYGGGMQPKAMEGYRKDFVADGEGDAEVYTICSKDGRYRFKAFTAKHSSKGAAVLLTEKAGILVGEEEVMIGCAPPPEEEAIKVEPEVYLKIEKEDAELKSAVNVKVIADEGAVEITAKGEEAKLTLDEDSVLEATNVSVKTKENTELSSEMTVKIAADGGTVEITANGEAAKLILDEDTVLEATSATVKANTITLECSYGSITVEDLMKRLERAEDKLGLPHTI